MTYSTGLDLHRQYAQIATVNSKGKVLIEARIANTKDDLTEFFSSGIYLRKNLTKHELALEPVSFWWPCYELLEELGIDVHLAHPLKVKAIASAKIKTDKIDAKVLAHLLRTDFLPEAYIPPKKIRNLKELLRIRASLVHIQTQVKNRLHSVLHKNSLIHEFSDLFGKAGLKWLTELDLDFPFNVSRSQHLELLKEIQIKIELVNKIIKQKTKENPLAMLLTGIPAISYYSALLVIAEIGDINRFPGPKKLHSYAGIIPCVYSSGDKTRYGRITKQGSRWLRWILIEAAQKQGQYQTKLGLYYKRFKYRKGTKIARVATARKLATIIFTMLKTGKPYCPFPRGQEDASPLSRH